MRLSSGSSLRRSLVRALRPGRPWRRRTVWAFGLALYGFAFAVRALHSVDLDPVIDTRDQPGQRMTRRYDLAAVSILHGEGVLFPAQPNPKDTGLLARPPGYPTLLAGLYALIGRSLRSTMLVQNVVTSLSSPLVFVAAGPIVGWPAAAVAGLLAATAPHLAFHSNAILPDALCVLPVAGGVLLVELARRRRSPSLLALAGAAFGISVWLRPNTLALGPFVAAGLALLARDRRRALRPAMILAVTSLLVVSPITIRNYWIYGEFVPVSINFGIVLWEGIGDAGGPRFGAQRFDPDVAQAEAVLYGDPRYGVWWASPDGIARDRARIRRSLDIILHNPAWFAAAALDRMRQMLDYPSNAPPLVAFSGRRIALPFDESGEGDPSPPGAPVSARWHEPGRLAGLEPILSDGTCRAVGGRLGWLRPLVRPLQSVITATLLPSILGGIVALTWGSWRRSLRLLLVPLCYLLFHSLMHLEFRVTLPMHALLFPFAGVTWALLGSAGREAVRRALAIRRPDGPR